MGSDTSSPRESDCEPFDWDAPKCRATHPPRPALGFCCATCQRRFPASERSGEGRCKRCFTLWIAAQA